MATAFEKYGGFATISKIVMTFYDHVLDCDELGHFFDNVDMARLVDHQTKFIATVMGGPASYSNEALHKVHMTLGITRADFDLVAGFLRQTLLEFEVKPADVEQIMAEIERRAPYVIAGPSK